MDHRAPCGAQDPLTKSRHLAVASATGGKAWRDRCPRRVSGWISAGWKLVQCVLLVALGVVSVGLLLTLRCWILDFDFWDIRADASS